jgi:hypothetical protein
MQKRERGKKFFDVGGLRAGERRSLTFVAETLKTAGRAEGSVPRQAPIYGPKNFCGCCTELPLRPQQFLMPVDSQGADHLTEPSELL